MARKDIGILPFFLIVGGILFLVLPVVFSGVGSPAVFDQKTRNLISCDGVVGGLLSVRHIDNLNCVGLRKCSFSDILGIKSIFGAKGYVTLVMGDGATDRRDYSINLFDSKEFVHLQACSTVKTGKVYLYGDGDLLKVYDIIVP